MSRPSEQEIDSLRTGLYAMSQEWREIHSTYATADPEEPLTATDWDELLTLRMLIVASQEGDDGTGQRAVPDAGDRRGLTIAEAWATVLIPARDLLTGPFANWALRVVEGFGVATFPHDAPDPGFPRREQGWYELGAAVPLLTGTSDVIEAGMRVILWAAASRNPHFCHRSEEYPILVWQWANNLVEFSNGVCRTLREVMAWVAAAFENLVGTMSGEVPGTLPRSGPEALQAVVLPAEQTALYVLERRSTGEIDIRFRGESGYLKGDWGRRLAQLLVDGQMHLLEFTGDESYRAASVTLRSKDEVELHDSAGELLQHALGKDPVLDDEYEVAVTSLRQVEEQIRSVESDDARQSLNRERKRLKNLARRLDRERRIPPHIRTARGTASKGVNRLKKSLRESMPEFCQHLDSAVRFDPVTDRYVYHRANEIPWDFRNL